MRRLPFLFFVVYLALIGGGPYYAQVFPIRIAHHIIMTLVLGGWLIHRIRTQGGIPQHPFNPLLFATIFLWIISAVFALDPRISLETVWFLMTHIIILWVIIAMIQRGRARFVMEVTFLMGALVIIFAGVQFADWLRQWLPLLHAEMPIPPVLPRLDQPFGVSTWLSGIAAPFALLLFVWAKSTRRRDQKIVLMTMASLMTVVLLFTASRGGYLSLAVGASIFIAIRLWNRKQINRLLPVIFGVGVLAAIAVVVIFMISQNASRMAGDRLRFDLWNTAIESVSADPVTGVGVGMFGRAHRLYRDGSFVDDRLATAHNLYLNTTAEIGLGGVILFIAFIGVGVHTWLSIWRSTESDKEKFRLEGATAALIGMGIHSIFDIFTLTSTVLLPIVLIAFITTPRIAVPPIAFSNLSVRRLATAGLIALVSLYGVGLLLSDRAQGEFNRSITDESIEAAQLARELDPDMRLYRLQNDYLIGADLNTAVLDGIASYQDALEAEPTWDIGWINLASLQLQAGDTAKALESLEHAAQINNANGAWFYWARLAEEQNAAPIDLIADRYVLSFLSLPVQPDYWLETEARRLAIDRFIESSTPEVRYRTYVNLERYDEAAALVPDAPVLPSEWWMSGHYALTVDKDPIEALERFNRGISLCKSCGTFYLWRAQAQATLSGITPLVERDLRIATLLTTPYDDLQLAQMELSATSDERRKRQIEFVGDKVLSQNFEAVLYQGRRAAFRTWISALNPPISDAARNVYIELAAVYESEGDVETATKVYQILLQIIPDDAEAQAELNRLESLKP